MELDLNGNSSEDEYLTDDKLQTIEEIKHILKGALKGVEFASVIIKNGKNIYLVCQLPLKPEDGERLDILELLIKDNGIIEFTYVIPMDALYERCCMVVNRLSEAAAGEPVQLYYQEIEHRFYMRSLPFKAGQIIYILNVLLFFIEGLLIFDEYLNGDNHRLSFDSACDAVTAVNSTLWDKVRMRKTFEDYNISTDDC